MPQPTEEDLSHDHRPTLTIDWEVYAAMLEDSDMPLEQQRELTETLWLIVMTCVDLGFDLNPVAQICGEATEQMADDLTDVVSLIENARKRNTKAKEDPWQD